MKKSFKTILQNNLLKKIIFPIIFLLALQFIFVITRSLVNVIPYRFLEKNIKSSAELLKKEGIFFSPTELNKIGIKYDNWTAADDYMLMIAAAQDKYTFLSFVPNYLALSKQAETPIEELSNYLEVNNGGRYEYGRYWAGSLVFLTPLTIFFDLSNIRIIFLFVSVILALLIIIKMVQKGEKLLAIIFGMFLIFSGLILNQMCIVYSQEGFVVLLALVYLYYFMDNNKLKEYEIYYFIGVGALTNFLYWLSYPLLTLEIILLIYLSMRLKEEKNVFIWLKHVIVDSLYWCIGFVVTMLTKGFLCKIYGVMDTGTEKASILMGDYSLIERIKIAFNRTIGDGGYFNKNILIGLFLMILVITLYCIITKKVFFKFNKAKIISYLLIAMYPLIWCFIVALHAQVHGAEIMLCAGSELAILLIYKDIIYQESGEKIEKEYKRNCPKKDNIIKSIKNKIRLKSVN